MKYVTRVKGFKILAIRETGIEVRFDVALGSYLTLPSYLEIESELWDWIIALQEKVKEEEHP